MSLWKRTNGVPVTGFRPSLIIPPCAPSSSPPSRRSRPRSTCSSSACGTRSRGRAGTSGSGATAGPRGSPLPTGRSRKARRQPEDRDAGVTLGYLLLRGRSAPRVPSGLDVPFTTKAHGEARVGCQAERLQERLFEARLAWTIFGRGLPVRAEKRLVRGDFDADHTSRGVPLDAEPARGGFRFPGGQLHHAHRLGGLRLSPELDAQRLDVSLETLEPGVRAVDLHHQNRVSENGRPIDGCATDLDGGPWTLGKVLSSDEDGGGLAQHDLHHFSDGLDARFVRFARRRREKV